jgi:hypothetical protein
MLMRSRPDTQSGMLFHQNPGQAEQKPENTDIHQKDFAGCCIWFKHLQLLR